MAQGRFPTWLRQISKIKRYAWFVTYDPRVMTRRHLKGIAGSNGDFLTIDSLYNHPTRNNVANVRPGGFTSLFAYVIRPFPPGQIGSAANEDGAQLYGSPFTTIKRRPGELLTV